MHYSGTNKKALLSKSWQKSRNQQGKHEQTKLNMHFFDWIIGSAKPQKKNKQTNTKTHKMEKWKRIMQPLLKINQSLQLFETKEASTKLALKKKSKSVVVFPVFFWTRNYYFLPCIKLPTAQNCLSSPNSRPKRKKILSSSGNHNQINRKKIELLYLQFAKSKDHT